MAEPLPYTQPNTVFLTEEDVFEGLPASPENVLVLLYDRTPDAWLDTWQHEQDNSPSQHVLVDVCEITRSAAADNGDSNPLNVHGITLELLEHDPSFDAAHRLIGTYLSAWVGESGDAVVIIDSLDWLLEHESLEAIREFLEGVAEQVYTAETGLYIIDGTGPETGNQFRRLFGDLNDADSATTSEAQNADRPEQQPGSQQTPPAQNPVPHADREELHERITRLRDENPTNYGYLKRNWAEAKRGIEATDRSYPTAKQIHAGLLSPESTPRTLGPALKAFETLDIIDAWDETVAANRYDLTKYDEERASLLGELLEECDE